MVIAHIDKIYREFLWTGKQNRSRKAPVWWDHIYDPVSAGGLNLIHMREWNKVTLGSCYEMFMQKTDCGSIGFTPTT